ncbi:unnamed protein product, partial [Cladocopium goreaui]
MPGSFLLMVRNDVMSFAMEAEDENDGLSYVRSGKKNKKSAKNGRQTFSMKDKVADIFQVQMFTRDKYKKSGLAQKIVRSTHFENL